MSKLKTELSESNIELDKALDDTSRYRSKLESGLSQSKGERTQALYECSKFKAELIDFKKEREQAFDDASRLRSKLSRCDTEKEQVFTELLRLKTELSESKDVSILLQQTLSEKQANFKEREEERQTTFKKIRQEKDSLQAKIFEFQAHLEQARLDKVECQSRIEEIRVEISILPNSDKDLLHWAKQKEALEALVYQQGNRL